jgi:ectoine hydroxylase-related dioxygenase (phytanoyl-CoA dioxygenase family)
MIADAPIRTYVPSEVEIANFREKGAVTLSAVASAADIDYFRPRINHAVDLFNTEKRALADRDTYGKAFLQVMNLWERDESVRAFTLHTGFARIAAQLLGVERVRIYHDQALHKEPGGGATPWHQDQYYWPLDTPNTITMWMPLIDLDASMGILCFAEGSHKDGLVKNIPISDESESLLNNYVHEQQYRVSMQETMKAGDASFHYGHTLHKAPGNASSLMREVMTVIYYADGARVTVPANPEQEADRLRWLNGLKPGELANSPLNPLLP